MARPPDGARTLAGYTLGPRLGADISGELYAGTGEGAREVQVLVVAPALAGDRAFTDHLTRQAAPRLHSFAHRAVVGTVLVAREGRDLVVVTEPARDARTVVDLLAAAHGRGGGLPPRVIAAIARAVIDGLASAHAAGLVHGAIHPRSVLVERDGGVRLTDLAVGFAAMSAAAAGSESMPLRGLSGFVSPEVALGDAPTAAADVYGVGALMYAMMTGDHPAGPMSTTPALERLVLRALDTDLTRRFASAIELQENFQEALEDDRCVPATAAELAQVWTETTAALAPRAPGPAGAADAVDAATEDLLASLDGVVEVSRPVSGRVPPVAVSVGGAARKPRTSNSLDAVLFDLDDEAAPAPASPAASVSAPVSAPVAIGSSPAVKAASIEPIPKPNPAPDPGPKPDPEPMPDPSPNPIPSPEPLPIPVTPPAIAKAEAPKTEAAKAEAPKTEAAKTEPAKTDSVPARKVARAASEVVPVEPPTIKRRSFAWLWLTIIAVGGAGLAFALVRQKDDLTAAQKESRDRKAKAKADREELERRLQAAQADPGSLRVHSHPDNAGVWLLLGRAPFDSISLDTGDAWQLRVELEGYQPKDLVIGNRPLSGQPSFSGWQGAGGAHHGELAVTLEPGAPAAPPPAIPPEPGPGDARGAAGAGRLSVTSTPPGAAVWLLVGVTDTMELEHIEAGRDYDLKVTKDGFLPGYVRFGAEEWRAGGDPELPLAAAPKKAVLERTVELVPAPKAGKGR
ncbi:MAG TPA: protein kinase [Kofleriaceae bacterium]|nr:protein kinase [Kofleriaceae bacterium]